MSYNSTMKAISKLIITSCSNDVGHSDVFGLLRVEVCGFGLAI